MISVAEAISIIKSTAQSLEPNILPLQEACGMKTAKDIFATIDIPFYKQSLVDGYAFTYNNWLENSKLKITGEIAAGQNDVITFNLEEAIRIFTGAVVPDEYDTVVMQEKTRFENGFLIIDDDKIKIGSNVRPKGAEIKAETLALEKGTILTPGAIGYLACIGIGKVEVLPFPKTTIIITGNELQQPGLELEKGQVYESNSYALTSVLKQLNIVDIKIRNAKDDLTILTHELQQALEESDLILLTGGVSVGKYDYVVEAAQNNKVITAFHKVKQRPGKPLYFGHKGNKVIFGLPGNPGSVLTCFYIYVLQALEILCNRTFTLNNISRPITNSYKKDNSFTHFLKGYYDGKSVKSLEGQESYKMKSYTNANCLIEINETTETVEENEMVKIHMFKN